MLGRPGDRHCRAPAYAYKQRSEQEQIDDSRLCSEEKASNQDETRGDEERPGSRSSCNPASMPTTRATLM